METDQDKAWEEMLAKLQAPFPPEKIKTREGKYRYLDARDIMDRLDAVVGAQNWYPRYFVADAETGAVICRLTIEWAGLQVGKEDFGHPNSPRGKKTSKGEELEKEPFKTSATDSFKRAAMEWGIGRELWNDPDKANDPSSTREYRGVSHDSSTDTRPATDGQVKGIVAVTKKLAALGATNDKGEPVKAMTEEEARKFSFEKAQGIMARGSAKLKELAAVVTTEEQQPEPEGSDLEAPV